MLCKILVTILVIGMNITDQVGAITGWKVCPVIDGLNEVAYKVEEVL